ncbi:unnamed protein product [Musa textilis]
METEMQQLIIPKPLQGRRHLDAHRDHHRYTSLRDILLLHRHRPAFCFFSSSHAFAGRSRHPPRGFDSSAICIRNRLVNHAASAYLQPAAIAADRSQNCITRIWWRLRQRPRGWQTCMRDPFEQCIGFVARSVSHALACIVGHLGRVCAWGRTSPT